MLISDGYQSIQVEKVIFFSFCNNPHVELWSAGAIDCIGGLIVQITIGIVWIIFCTILLSVCGLWQTYIFLKSVRFGQNNLEKNAFIFHGALDHSSNNYLISQLKFVKLHQKKKCFIIL